MRKREHLFLTFFIFLILSLLIVFLGRISWLEGLRGTLESLFNPLQNSILGIPKVPASIFINKELDRLAEENNRLTKLILDQKNLEKENQAFADQFSTTATVQLQLLPAKIIAMPSFVPGVSDPKYLIIDKGGKDDVVLNSAVIYKDNLLGKVTKVSINTSMVQIATDESSSFTAKTLGTNAIGIVSGNGGKESTFGNVLLSDKLEINDIVATSGEIEEEKVVFPAGLIVGKIVSVDKKSSELFQSAIVESSLNLAKLSTVFVVLGYK